MQVKASLSCTAEALKWLWVLHGVIEKTMLAQAKENITALIDYFQEGVNTNAHQDTTPRVSWRFSWTVPFHVNLLTSSQVSSLRGCTSQPP